MLPLPLVSEPRLRGPLARAARAEPTYAEVGAADAPSLPAGYVPTEQERVAGHGAAALARLGDALLAWDLHREAGMTVAATGPVAPGATVVMAAPYGPIAFTIPCRVVRVIEEERRRGFQYGTLPGNPVQGEERFTAELGDDGAVRLGIRSFSRLASVARLAPPLARRAQATVNGRYLAAAGRLTR